VKKLEVSIVKRQRESVDVASLRQNAAMDTRTRDPFPVPLSAWHSVSTATSN